MSVSIKLYQKPCKKDLTQSGCVSKWALQPMNIGKFLYGPQQIISHFMLPFVRVSLIVSEVLRSAPECAQLAEANRVPTHRDRKCRSASLVSFRVTKKIFCRLAHGVRGKEWANTLAVYSLYIFPDSPQHLAQSQHSPILTSSARITPGFCGKFGRALFPDLPKLALEYW